MYYVYSWYMAPLPSYTLAVWPHSLHVLLYGPTPFMYSCCMAPLPLCTLAVWPHSPHILLYGPTPFMYSCCMAPLPSYTLVWPYSLHILLVYGPLPSCTVAVLLKMWNITQARPQIYIPFMKSNIVFYFNFSLLMQKKLHRYELAALANLCPESADEAKALIPRLVCCERHTLVEILSLRFRCFIMGNSLSGTMILGNIRWPSYLYL